MRAQRINSVETGSVRPNRKAEERIERYFGHCRFIYNHFMDLRDYAFSSQQVMSSQCVAGNDAKSKAVTVTTVPSLIN